MKDVLSAERKKYNIVGTTVFRVILGHLLRELTFSLTIIKTLPTNKKPEKNKPISIGLSKPFKLFKLLLGSQKHQEANLKKILFSWSKRVKHNSRKQKNAVFLGNFSSFLIFFSQVSCELVQGTPKAGKKEVHRPHVESECKAEERGSIVQL
jgi:hypothetical protein